MVAGTLRIIDHQDARMGPVTYDLVPLLVERRLRPVDESWVDEQLEHFLAAPSAGSGGADDVPICVTSFNS
jgi:aminoglycoside/choline kinase family phosphotransferase